MKFRLLLLSMSLLLALILCGCNDNYTNEVTEFAMIAEGNDLSVLDMYPNLEYVDLRGSSCYEEILEYAETNPHINVRYNVSLGSTRFAQDTEEITLNPADFDFQSLLDHLKYLPRLKKLRFIQMSLTQDQLSELVTTYPNIEIAYDLNYCDHIFDAAQTEIDLSFIQPNQIEEVIPVISMLPNLTAVNLTNAIGTSNLSIADVRVLTDIFPYLNFHYRFKLFGKEVSTTDPELAFTKVHIGNEGMPQISNALAIMKQCNYVLLDSCDIDDEYMQDLRDLYPQKEIVWRVTVGRYDVLTDEEVISMTYKLTDENATALKYCTKVKYIDLSTNSLSNFNFLANMPDLECAILTLTNIKDLSPLANCQNLTWLELYSCGYLEDISPLSQVKNLKYLNIGGTKVSDISALSQLSLERFVCAKARVSENDVEEFAKQHPNCMTSGENAALGYGWRYNDKKQKEPFAYFTQLQEVFGY